jgi:hypothetical protein
MKLHKALLQVNMLPAAFIISWQRRDAQLGNILYDVIMAAREVVRIIA